MKVLNFQEVNGYCTNASQPWADPRVISSSRDLSSFNSKYKFSLWVSNQLSLSASKEPPCNRNSLYIFITIED